ncbi:MAG: DUF1444 family protein, partial [Planctomycetaceae bacterium]|nr:DUF1444 family protein [Planctomycetaceae bacterium]
RGLLRILSARRSYHWFLWCFSQHDQANDSGKTKFASEAGIVVVATLQFPDGTAPDLRMVRFCRQIIATLQINERPAWPPDLFRRQVIELGRRKFPLSQIQSAPDFSIRIGDSGISLVNFYRSYLLQPDQFERLLIPAIATVIRLQELGPDHLCPNLEDAQDRILPMLSASDDLQKRQLVHIPWIGGLHITFVLDEDTSYRFIHQQLMDDWQVAADDLMDIALRNLRQYASDHPLEVTVIGDDDDPRLLMPLNPDAYNASRLLDPGFHGRLRELFGPELLVGVPNRDFFIAVSMRHPDLVPRIRERIDNDYATMHHPLTKRLLVISADGVSEYCESDA